LSTPEAGYSSEASPKAPDFTDPSVMQATKDYLGTIDRSSEADILKAVHELEVSGVLTREHGAEARADDVFGGAGRVHLNGANTELTSLLTDLRIDAVGASSGAFSDRLEEVLRDADTTDSKGVALARAVGDSFVGGEVTLHHRQPPTPKGGRKPPTVVEPQMQGSGAMHRAKNQVVIDQVAALPPDQQVAYQAELKRLYPHLDLDRKSQEQRQMQAERQRHSDEEAFGKLKDEATTVHQAREEVRAKHPEVWSRYQEQLAAATTEAERHSLSNEFDETARRIAELRRENERTEAAARQEEHVEAARQKIASEADSQTRLANQIARGREFADEHGRPTERLLGILRGETMNDANEQALAVDYQARAQAEVYERMAPLIAAEPDMVRRQELERQRDAAIREVKDLLVRNGAEDAKATVSALEAASHHEASRATITFADKRAEERAQLRHGRLGLEPMPFLEVKSGGLMHLSEKKRGPKVLESYFRVPGNDHLLMVERRKRRSGDLVSQTIVTTERPLRETSRGHYLPPHEVRGVVADVREHDRKALTGKSSGYTTSVGDYFGSGSGSGAFYDDGGVYARYGASRAERSRYRRRRGGFFFWLSGERR
jgi:hypothetical protein